jgi:hypothetical protein
MLLLAKGKLMTISIENDPRYSGLSEFASAELGVYLQWLKDANLEDTEYSFIAYLLGRCGILDFRHLYKIWESQIGDNADISTKRMIRRFFANPSPAVSFKQPSVSGWFEFISTVHNLKDQISSAPLNQPVFTKVGFDELPKRNTSTGYLFSKDDNNPFANSPDKQEHHQEISASGVQAIISTHAQQLIGHGTHFYSFFLEGSSAEKKLLNFSKAYSKAHYEAYDPKNEKALLFYDGTILGSGKEGILFTENCIRAHGSLGDGVKSTSLKYNQIKTVFLSNKNSEEKYIYIDSHDHAATTVLQPIFIHRDDVILLKKMIEQLA